MDGVWAVFLRCLFSGRRGEVLEVRARMIVKMVMVVMYRGHEEKRGGQDPRAKGAKTGHGPQFTQRRHQRTGRDKDKQAGRHCKQRTEYIRVEQIEDGRRCKRPRWTLHTTESRF